MSGLVFQLRHSSPWRLRLFVSKLVQIVVEHLQDKLSVFVLKTQVLYLDK